MPQKARLAEYIWVDGTEPTAELRSKTKVMDPDLVPSSRDAEQISLDLFPEWSADGSSTNQAPGSRSDIILRPVRAVPDPFRQGNYLVLCEVFNADGSPHPTNTRARLRKLLDEGAGSTQPMFGFEQEYTFFKRTGTPIGFPADGYPPPQGPYYCGVGANKIRGRHIYESFLDACLEARVSVTGVNWEVMPGQAEVQVFGGALSASDDLWLTRWILHRAAEDFDTIVSFEPKPAKGDWNGAGMHTNFSTASMRASNGMQAIEDACSKLSTKVDEHLAVYGFGYQERLTGSHETCPYTEFRWGVSDRTASVRVPHHVAKAGTGYLEDRRPNANADPYLVAGRILATVCELPF